MAVTRDVGPPPIWRWLAEYPRAGWTLASYPHARRVLAGASDGDGRPVMLLPGLFNSDRSVAILRRYLARLGYGVESWGLGRNLGGRTVGDDAARLIDRVAAMRDAAGAPVTLIGVSLGGIMARLVAQRRPELVREVVTISSPFAGPARATNVWRAFELITGERIDAPEVQAMLAEAARPLSVPATALWSASDGLVNGSICRAGDAGCRNIEIQSGHLLVQIKPAVMRLVADVLADAVD